MIPKLIPRDLTELSFPERKPVIYSDSDMATRGILWHLGKVPSSCVKTLAFVVVGEIMVVGVLTLVLGLMRYLEVLTEIYSSIVVALFPKCAIDKLLL